MAKQHGKLRLRTPTSMDEWVAFAEINWRVFGESARFVQLARLVAIRHRLTKDKAAREAVKAKLELERGAGRLRRNGLSRGVVHIFAPNLSGSAKTRAISLVRMARNKSIPAKAVLARLQRFGLDRFLRDKGQPKQKTRITRQTVREALARLNRDVTCGATLGTVELDSTTTLDAGLCVAVCASDEGGRIRVISIYPTTAPIAARIATKLHAAA
jgi:hypothetical protein